jgi:hypothetical protein
MRAILYPNCSLAFFDVRAAKTLQECDDDLLEAERTLERARDDLLASGASIPPSTPVLQTMPRGGGLDTDERSPSRTSRASRDSLQARAAHRRRMNKWNSEANSGSPESRVTKNGRANLSKLNSGRSRSSTASANSYRERKLMEHIAEQERLRVEATKD